MLLKRLIKVSIYLVATITLVFSTKGLFDSAANRQTALAGASGFPSFAQEFDPYGSNSGFVGRGSSHYRFAGEWIDSAGLQYLRARYYSPAQGRFISRDPFPGMIDQPASLNPYSYALNNPVLYTDPSGEFVETIFDAAMLGYDLFTIIDKAGRGCSIGLADWGALGLDALSLAVPFLPAGGLVLRLSSHLDDFRAIIKSTDRSKDLYWGVRSASKYLKDAGVPRSLRKQIIESFDIRTIQVRLAGKSEYGIRYFDNVNSFEKGRFLFETFPASRESLAIKSEWNQMTKIKQWKIRPGTTLIQGRTASQGIYLPGGHLQ